MRCAILPRMRPLPFLPLAALSLARPHAADKPALSPEKLMDRVIMQPGNYDPMCGMPEPATLA